MSFASFNFIVLFLPSTILVYFLVSQFNNNVLNSLVLSAASLIFYGYFSILFLSLLLFSIFFNYYLSILIQNNLENKRANIFYFSIFFNLFYLCIFKYTTPFLMQIDLVSGSDLSQYYIPFFWGVSFFTFQQITYQIQSYEKQISENRFWVYLNFITFFPYILSGPITRYTEIGKAISNLKYLSYKNLLIGLSIFGIGLFKKTVIAENLQDYSNTLFNIPIDQISFFDAWVGILAFAFQVYFDFSGYSDMAIGLARCFGLILPINFFSPYKASSIVDFWKRWHMTMTRFFTDFVYTPLAMKWARKSLILKISPFNTFMLSVVFPTILTFILIGFWHEASLNFLLFGLLHGIGLSLNQYWKTKIKIALPKFLCWLFTFIFVVFTLVLFVSTDLKMTLLIWNAMTVGILDKTFSFNFVDYMSVFWICVSFGICFILPNVYEFFRKYRPGQKTNLIFSKSTYFLSVIYWRPSTAYSIILGALFTLGVIKSIGTSISSFVYVQF